MDDFEVPLHAKNQALGNKKVLKSHQVILEKIDIEKLKENDKLVLLKWGVF